MTVNVIHLRKFLQFCALDRKGLERALRKELYSDIQREDKTDDHQPMDYYGCFWADAKHSVLHGLDLKLATEDRIAKNKLRKRLYPILERGFTDWWRDELRGTNLLITPEEATAHTRWALPDIGITLKFENFLALKVGHDQYRLVYPYFSEKPPLEDKWIRIGLWLLDNALPQFGLEAMRLLDVQRGKGYSSITNPLSGTEEAELREKCVAMLALWRELNAAVGRR
jgi:hypothetical protein